MTTRSKLVSRLSYLVSQSEAAVNCASDQWRVCRTAAKLPASGLMRRSATGQTVAGRFLAKD
jgi:hypothetical protein